MFFPAVSAPSPDLSAQPSCSQSLSAWSLLLLPSQKGPGLSWNTTVASDKLSSLPGETLERAVHMIQGQSNQPPPPQGSVLQKPCRTLSTSVQPTGHRPQTTQCSHEETSNNILNLLKIL